VSALDLLSPREREVLACVLLGDTTKDIAYDCDISMKTVETHRTHINRKLRARSPVDLMLMAVANGWLVADSGGQHGVRVTFAYVRRKGRVSTSRDAARPDPEEVTP